MPSDTAHKNLPPLKVFVATYSIIFHNLVKVVYVFLPWCTVLSVITYLLFRTSGLSNNLSPGFLVHALFHERPFDVIDLDNPATDLTYYLVSKFGQSIVYIFLFRLFIQSRTFFDFDKHTLKQSLILTVALIIIEALFAFSEVFVYKFIVSNDTYIWIQRTMDETNASFDISFFAIIIMANAFFAIVMPIFDRIRLNLAFIAVSKINVRTNIVWKISSGNYFRILVTSFIVDAPMLFISFLYHYFFNIYRVDLGSVFADIAIDIHRAAISQTITVAYVSILYMFFWEEKKFS